MNKEIKNSNDTISLEVFKRIPSENFTLKNRETSAYMISLLCGADKKQLNRIEKKLDKIIINLCSTNAKSGLKKN